MDTTLDHSLLSGIDMSSKDEFLRSMQRIPREQVSRLNDIMLAKREEAERPYRDWTVLYHGTSMPNFDAITKDGFALTTGYRSVGGLGARVAVQNQGIFLTDAPNLAHYFGDNRSDGQYRVIKVQVDTSRVMSSDHASKELKRLGLRLVNDYENTQKTKLAIRDWWWLVDQEEFVQAIKAEGHTGVRFKEETSVRRQAEALDGHTYCIFDTKLIRQEHEGAMSITAFYEWLKSQL